MNCRFSPLGSAVVRAGWKCRARTVGWCCSYNRYSFCILVEGVCQTCVPLYSMYLLCHNGFASIFINIYNISRRASVAKLIQQYQCDMYDIFMKRVILIHVNNNMSLSCVRTVCSSLESENILIRVSVVSKFVIHSSYCGSSNIYNKRHGIWLRCEAWHILPSLNISIYLCHTHTFALHTAQCTHTLTRIHTFTNNYNRAIYPNKFVCCFCFACLHYENGRQPLTYGCNRFSVRYSSELVLKKSDDTDTVNTPSL